MGYSGTIVTSPDLYPEDVGHVIGVQSYDQAVICRSKSVKWQAKYKPVGGSHDYESSEAMRVALNQGMLVEDANMHSIWHTTAENAFQAAEDNGGDWKGCYINEDFYWARITDFVPANASPSVPSVGNGYDHAAVSFIKAEASQFDLDNTTSWKCSVRFQYQVIPAGLKLQDFAVFNNKGTSSNPPDATWYWGVVYRGAGNQNGWDTLKDSNGNEIAIGQPTAINDGVRILGYFNVPTYTSTTQIEFHLCAICRSNVGQRGLVGIIWLPEDNRDSGYSNTITHLSPTATVALAWWTTGGGTNSEYLMALTIYRAGQGNYTKLYSRMQVLIPVASVSGPPTNVRLTWRVRKKSTSIPTSKDGYSSGFSVESSGVYYSSMYRFDDLTIPPPPAQGGVTCNTQIDLTSLNVSDLSDLETCFEISINYGPNVYFDGLGNWQSQETWTDLTDVINYLTSWNVLQKTI